MFMARPDAESWAGASGQQEVEDGEATGDRAAQKNEGTTRSSGACWWEDRSRGDGLPRRPKRGAEWSCGGGKAKRRLLVHVRLTRRWAAWRRLSWTLGFGSDSTVSIATVATPPCGGKRGRRVWSARAHRATEILLCVAACGLRLVGVLDSARLCAGRALGLLGRVRASCCMGSSVCCRRWCWCFRCLRGGSRVSGP